MKKATNKNVTIDDLAIMMTKGFKDVYKEVANGHEETENLARMVAKGFAGVHEEMNERFNKVEKRLEKVENRLEKVETKLEKVEENLNTTRIDVLGIGDRFVSKHKFNQHLVRFDLLAQKVKTKK